VFAHFVVAKRIPFVSLAKEFADLNLPILK